MTYWEFISECVARLISPDIALENENIKQAAISGDIEELRRVLEEEC